jgi:rod shape-determining protein MreC
MTRDSGQSRILFPALVFLSLLLMSVPETHVDAARTRVLSALHPILSRFAAWKMPPPRVATINVPAPGMQAEKDKASAVPGTTAAAAPNDASELDLYRARNAELESDLLRYKNSEPFAGVTGKMPAGLDSSVIARKILWQEPILGIDKGEADGVRMNAGVLHRGAVLGRIVAVSAHASSLALLTHRGVSIAARLSECRVEGELRGSRDENGDRVCVLSIATREAAPKIGENVVTSGYDGAFPPGLWMGVVTAIHKTGDFKWELTVRPACNDNAVEIVHVLTGVLPEVPWPVVPGSKRK